MKLPLGSRFGVRRLRSGMTVPTGGSIIFR